MEVGRMEEEISLRELIEILIKRRMLIVSITVVCILLGGIVSFLVLEPVYETRMVLMASQFTDKIQATERQGEGIDNILNSLSNYPTMTLETYRQQITAPRVMRETISQLGLEDEYDVESLAKDITLETIKDTNLISIKMQHTNSEKAAEIVNAVGENFVDFVAVKAKENATTSSAYIENQIEIEKAKLDEALEELKEFLSQPRGVSELSKEIEARLRQITDYKTSLTDLEIRQEALEAAILVAESEAKDTNRILLRDQDDYKSMQLTIEDSATLLKIEQAEVESNIKSIKDKLLTLQQEIEKTQVELQDKTHQERQINQKVSIAQNTYDAFIKKYEELRVTESSQIGEATITVMSRAYPTTQPVAPRKALNVAIAAVLGLMMGVFTAFFIEYWQSSEKNKINTVASN